MLIVAILANTKNAEGFTIKNYMTLGLIFVCAAGNHARPVMSNTNDLSESNTYDSQRVITSIGYAQNFPGSQYSNPDIKSLNLKQIQKENLKILKNEFEKIKSMEDYIAFSGLNHKIEKQGDEGVSKAQRKAFKKFKESQWLKKRINNYKGLPFDSGTSDADLIKLENSLIKNGIQVGSDQWRFIIGKAWSRLDNNILDGRITHALRTIDDYENSQKYKLYINQRRKLARNHKRKYMAQPSHLFKKNQRRQHNKQKRNAF